MPDWSKVLLKHENGKAYTSFLKWLLQQNYYSEREEKLTITKIATLFKADAFKVRKWLREIYEDIINLNYDNPELFWVEGLKVTLYMKHYDSRCRLNVSLPALSRQSEMFNVPFAKARVGIDSFFVKKVEYLLTNDRTRITISLEEAFVSP